MGSANTSTLAKLENWLRNVDLPEPILPSTTIVKGQVPVSEVILEIFHSNLFNYKLCVGAISRFFVILQIQQS